jgi:hypothetical protein
MTQRRIYPLLSLLLGALVMTAGCGRMNTLSEVKPDGTLVRTLTFKGGDANPKPSGPGGSEGGNPMAAMMGGGPSMPIEAIAVIPKGNEWTVTRTKKESEVTITATRTIPPGQTITDDLGLRMEPDETFMRSSSPPVEATPKPAPKPAAKPAPKPTTKPGTKPKPKPSGGGSKPGELHLAVYAAPTRQAPPPPKLMLSNTVTVREIEPGKLEYREVLHWNGPHPKDFDQPDSEMVANLRKALPASLANDPAVPKITLTAQKEIFALLFGPGEPVLPLVLFHQELAEYRLMGRIGGALDRALVAEFGNRITDAERKAVVEKLMKDATSSVTDKTKKPPSGDNDPTSGMGNSMPVAMLFRVKMPGKVISTNGQWNPDTGEVIWPMYSLAPSIGDVTLIAVCEKP